MFALSGIAYTVTSINNIFIEMATTGAGMIP
jgi:hypothetical protein